MSDIKLRLNDDLEKRVRDKAANDGKTINATISALIETGLAVSVDRSVVPEIVELMRNEIRIEVSNLYSMLSDQLAETEDNIAEMSQTATSAALANLVASAEKGKYIDDIERYRLAGSYISLGKDPKVALSRAKEDLGNSIENKDSLGNILEKALWDD